MMTNSRCSSWPGALAAITLAAVVAGCSVASAPIENPQSVVATPKTGELSVTAHPSPQVGNVTPLFLSIANGTDAPRTITPSQIFAINSDGDRVAPLPAGEAARQAGGAKKLSAVLKSGAVSGAAGGVVGAALGAAAGAAIGGPAAGAALGGAIGAGTGAFEGARAGADDSGNQAQTQMNSLAMPAGEVRKDFTVSGYVFYPKGNYNEIEMVLVNSETGNTETIREAWHNQ